MKILLYMIFIFALLFTLEACNSSDNFQEKGEIFHAAPTSSAIGEIYFGLYNDGTYEICNSGGIGQDCYKGKFILKRDTLILLDLSKKLLKSNRLLIIRYTEQDSTFWKWKYSNSSYDWQHLKSIDTNDGTGNVFQLDSSNKLMNTSQDAYFIIRLDSLKNYYQN